MTTLVLQELRTDHHHVINVGRVLIAGFTGRDTVAVDAHVGELAVQGVPVPARTPTLYRVDPSLVRQSTALVVNGTETSGEVEPVIVMSNGQLLLTIGSDHTDRAMERHDIALSKGACPKAVGTHCVPVEAIQDWDATILTSWIDDDVLYQDASLAELLPLESILSHLEDVEGVTLQEGDVLFLGTVPAIGGIRPSRTFASRILLQDRDELRLDYRIVDVSSTGRDRLGKPEQEFFDVDHVDWTPIPGGVEGQAERLLATDQKSGLSTRMLRFEPGTDTSELGVLRHDFWEEVYILAGELHDLTLDQVFPAGTYACRPPGMPHGPWRSEPGCITFEVRYPAM